MDRLFRLRTITSQRIETVSEIIQSDFRRVAKKEVQLVYRSSDERCSVVKIWH